MILTEYVATRFDPKERWQVVAGGDAGHTLFQNNLWRFDFEKNPKWVALVPQDATLLGTAKQIRLRVKGDSCGHPLRLVLATHFMHFEYSLGPVRGAEEQTLVLPAPPADGWRFYGGENDGKLHGPLRIVGFYLDEVPGQRDAGAFELLDVRVQAECSPGRTGVLYARSEPDRFVAVLKTMNPTPLLARVRCLVRDWDGRVFRCEEQTARLAAGGGDIELYFPKPQMDSCFLEAEFTVEAVDQIFWPASVCDVRPVEPRPDRKPDPASPFGMGVYLYRFSNTPAGLADLARAAQIAGDMGVKWSREEFHWANIEKEKGVFDFSFYDRVVEAAGKNGITIYGLLAYWSAFTKPYTLEGIRDYCDFAEAVVKRYRRDIKIWELWNEPNIFFWSGPKELYPELVKAAYARIKQADPEAQVAAVSISGLATGHDFVNLVLDAKAPFDILTVHPYRPELIEADFIRELQEAADWVRRQDGARRPVWITEMGWATNVPHNSGETASAAVSERQQARLLVRAYMAALASGACDNFSWYDLRCDGNAPMEFEHQLGILRRDFSCKPAARAFAVMTRALEGRTFVKFLDWGAETFACLFADKQGDRPVTIAWTYDRVRAMEMTAEEPVTVTNLMGESQILRPEHGKVRVMLHPLSPVFIG